MNRNLPLHFVLYLSSSLYDCRVHCSTKRGGIQSVWSRLEAGTEPAIVRWLTSSWPLMTAKQRQSNEQRRRRQCCPVRMQTEAIICLSDTLCRIRIQTTIDKFRVWTRKTAATRKRTNNSTKMSITHTHTPQIQSIILVSKEIKKERMNEK